MTQQEEDPQSIQNPASIPKIPKISKAQKPDRNYQKMINRKVTAKINCVIQRHGRDHVFAARFPDLGLTGYGSTKEEAMRSCKSLYRTFVRTYRSRNMFPAVLERAGVQWSYAN